MDTNRMAGGKPLRAIFGAAGWGKEDATSPLVVAFRETLSCLINSGKPAFYEVAVRLLEARLDEYSRESPLAINLRPWQLLASDLSVALTDLDKDLSMRARTVADEFRSIISMMYRNPADSLILRPASRRVLVALHELGGRAPAEKVRAISGHSVTHLSNILKALRGHGVVAEETAPEDRRRKVLSLTDAGRSMIEKSGLRPVPAPELPARFVSAIQVRLEPAGHAQTYFGDLGIVKHQQEEV